MIALLDNYLTPGGRIVMNTVSDDSRMGFKEAIEQLSYQMDPEMSIQINEYNKITLLGATKTIL